MIAIWSLKFLELINAKNLNGNEEMRFQGKKSQYDPYSIILSTTIQEQNWALASVCVES